MRDIPRLPRLRHRPQARIRSAHPSSREAPAATTPRVVGGLMRGQPEMAVLLKAAANLARIDFVDDRLAIVSTVLATHPAALVLPPFDAKHTSTAPLVLRVRREAPGVAVLVIACHPGGAGQPILRALQAGAQVIPSATAEQLHERLAGLLGT